MQREEGMPDFNNKRGWLRNRLQGKVVRGGTYCSESGGGCGVPPCQRSHLGRRDVVNE